MMARGTPFQFDEIQFTNIAEISDYLARLDVGNFVQRLRQVGIEEATELLRDLILKEQFLSENNSLEAYAEKLPPILEGLKVSFLCEIADYLEASLLRKALFGNFRAVSHTKLIKILEGMHPAKAAGVFEEMIFGIDPPRQAAKSLSNMVAERASLIVALMNNYAILRVFREMERTVKAKILEGLDPKKAFELCDLMLGDRNEVRIARVLGILDGMGGGTGLALWNKFDSQDQQRLHAMTPPSNSWDSMNLRKAILD